MNWIRLPDGFLRSPSLNVQYAFQKAFLPDARFVSTASRSSPRAALESFFTGLQLEWVQVDAEDRERYRFPGVTNSATCAFLWAGCLAASESEGTISRLEEHFTAFLELNQSILFGEWPPTPVVDALASVPWHLHVLKWRQVIQKRDAGTLMGSFPDMTRPPLELVAAMSPAHRAEYPNLLWRGGLCRVVPSRLDEDAARVEGWRAYGEPDVDLAKDARGLPPEPPLLSLATWSDVEIWFLSEERVELTVKGERATLNYTELGFEDRRTGKPTFGWTVLRELAKADGTLKGFHDREQIKKSVQTIRSVLRAHLERQHISIPDDPLPYIKALGYQAQFMIGVRSSFHH